MTIVAGRRAIARATQPKEPLSSEKPVFAQDDLLRKPFRKLPERNPCSRQMQQHLQRSTLFFMPAYQARF